MKRQRGRGRKPGGGGHQHHNNQPNRSMESNGPDVKVRGPASHIFERYSQLARDAASAGDRVMSENYLQHAEHYFRLWRQLQPAAPPPQHDRFNGDSEFDGEDAGAERDIDEAGAEAGGENEPDAEAGMAQGQPQQGFERDDGDGNFRRRRGRRNRYRPEGERQPGGEEGAREGGGEASGEQRMERRERQPREDRGERRERAPREERGEREGAEGFAVGPKPAFLRTE